MLLLIQPQQTISEMVNEWFEEESVAKCHFNGAKHQVAIDQKNLFGRENTDFFGREFDLKIKPYLEESYNIKFHPAVTAFSKF